MIVFETVALWRSRTLPVKLRYRLSFILSYGALSILTRDISYSSDFQSSTQCDIGLQWRPLQRVIKTWLVWIAEVSVC